MDHVDVTGEPAQVGGEPRMTARLRLDAVRAAVEQDGAEATASIPRHTQLIVDDNACHQLALRGADDAELALVDEEPLLMTDLIDPPAEPPQVDVLLLEREGEVVGIARVGPAVAFGEPVQAGVEAAADKVRDGRRGRRSLRQ